MIEKDFSPDDIFSGMSQVEQAFYAKFKLSQHSRVKRKALLSTLESSGLNKEKIDKITSEHAFSKSHPENACGRCGSFKVYPHKVDGKKKADHCLVCGFVKGTKKKTKFKLLNFLFGR